MHPIKLNRISEHRAVPVVSNLEQDWTLVECGRVLFRRKLLLCSIVGLVSLAALLASAVETPMYRSQASLQIQGLNDNFLNLRDLYPTATPPADNAANIQTQAEILRQDTLQDKAIERLHLEQRPGKAVPAESTAAAAAGLKRNVQITPVRGSNIIRIVCAAREAQLAADFANSLAQSFIEEGIEARKRSVRQTLSLLGVERDALRTRLAQLEGQVDAPGWREKGSPSYRTLNRELDASRQFYQSISQRIDEAQVASAMDQSNIRLVSPALPAARPYKPNLALNLTIGVVAGLLLGIGYIMLREQTSTVWNMPGQASASLAIPELGVIPMAGTRGFDGIRLKQGPRAMPIERISLDQASSGLSECFRAATASILSAGHNGDAPRVLVVTSARSGEGKTTVASNLAIALTEIGVKVLLIDGDLRHPRLHQIFHQPNTWGLSDLLREKNAVEDVPLETLVKRTSVPRLYLLPGGTSADNVFALLLSGRMARLVPRFRQAFDYVLIDAPPCLEFADARILGRIAQKVILVVRAGYTGRQTAQAAVQRLSLDRIPIMGVIFNGWDPSQSDAYGYTRSRCELA